MYIFAVSTPLQIALNSQLSSIAVSLHAWFNLFSAQSIIIICIKISDIVAVIWQSPALLWSFYWACLHRRTQPIILTSLKMKMKQTRFQYILKINMHRNKKKGKRWVIQGKSPSPLAGKTAETGSGFLLFVFKQFKEPFVIKLRWHADMMPTCRHARGARAAFSNNLFRRIKH